MNNNTPNMPNNFHLNVFRLFVNYVESCGLFESGYVVRTSVTPLKYIPQSYVYDEKNVLINPSYKEYFASLKKVLKTKLPGMNYKIMFYFNPKPISAKQFYREMLCLYNVSKKIKSIKALYCRGVYVQKKGKIGNYCIEDYFCNNDRATLNDMYHTLCGDTGDNMNMNVGISPNVHYCDMFVYFKLKQPFKEYEIHPIGFSRFDSASST